MEAKCTLFSNSKNDSEEYYGWSEIVVSDILKFKRFQS